MHDIHIVGTNLGRLMNVVLKISVHSLHARCRHPAKQLLSLRFCTFKSSAFIVAATVAHEQLLCVDWHQMIVGFEPAN